MFHCIPPNNYTEYVTTDFRIPKGYTRVRLLVVYAWWTSCHNRTCLINGSNQQLTNDLCWWSKCNRRKRSKVNRSCRLNSTVRRSSTQRRFSLSLSFLLTPSRALLTFGKKKIVFVVLKVFYRFSFRTQMQILLFVFVAFFLHGNRLMRSNRTIAGVRTLFNENSSFSRMSAESPVVTLRSARNKKSHCCRWSHNSLSCRLTDRWVPCVLRIHRTR